jgi:hypothetical protein
LGVKNFKKLGFGEIIFGGIFGGIVIFEVKTGVGGLVWVVWARWARKKCAKMSKK